METCQGVQVITCKGSFRRMGETIGETIRDYLVERTGRIPPDDITRARIKKCLASSEQVIPEIMDAIRGMEQGAGLPEGVLLAGQANFKKQSMFPDACSNVVFRDGPQGPLWGKNNDDDWANPCHLKHPGPSNPPDHFYILRMYPDNGVPLINCTYKGWIGAGDMMNAEGVAAGFSSGGSRFQQSPFHIPDRLWMAACMFKARTADDYARRLSGIPVRGKGYLGVVVDRKGGMCAPEIMPPMVQLRQIKPWMRGLACANCYQLSDLANLSGRGNQENARGRAAWLAFTLKNPELSLEYMQTILRHHGEFDICRHGEERNDYGFTEWSMIGIPRAGKVLFCAGQPCHGQYDEIGF